MTLDTAVLAQLKEKLVAEKTRLEAELRRFAKPTGGEGNFETQFDVIGTDPDENATEVEEYTDNLALDKMEKGTYGVCEKTGEDIPVERLMAYPAARTKVDA